jgi:hypothetical protein
MTDKLKLQAPWSEVKEQLKENNIDLTDEDLEYSPGKENELLERLQLKMNRSKKDIQSLIESISFNRSRAS